ncbi:LANO_0B06128g1_1 [Lachancea nothofagi CBS 11611]|uniref:LANO_0B06128g1_1 n=1 Tax=Lachancea nothofagi CBS 11611 TaxID=1266666 RepID=A0A1G4IYW1_9SACH|nr:LANO_0B06128g1_1 [Lachancea nothofagi CBS 11611]
MTSLLTETEPQDALPFIKDATPSFESNERILAPSIDEVDSNPDELRSIRGKGRYFGVTDPSDSNLDAEPKCNNCSQRGHFKRNCPHVICSYCGLMDDHYSQHCPRAIRCANCNGEGHYRSQCPHKWRRVFCTLCNSKKHARDRCPSIWRSYFLLDGNKRRVLPIHRIFCYNCGSKGHFGDDCFDERSSRVPNEDGSAFSGENLPQQVKENYFTHLERYRDDFSEDMSYHSRDIRQLQAPKHPKGKADDSMYEDDSSSSSRSRKSKKRSRNGEEYGDHSQSRYRNNASKSNFFPPPYQKSKPAPRPSSRGNLLPPTQNRKHPLDFPRSSKSQHQRFDY